MTLTNNLSSLTPPHVTTIYSKILLPKSLVSFMPTEVKDYEMDTAIIEYFLLKKIQLELLRIPSVLRIGCRILVEKLMAKMENLCLKYSELDTTIIEYFLKKIRTLKKSLCIA